MKVILLQDIKGVGRKWEVKDLKDGYVRNFLLPKKSVEAATPAALKNLEQLKEKQAEEHAKSVEILKNEAAKLKELELVFKVKTDEKGGVFGSITSRDIETELREKGIQNAKVVLEHPIKKIGSTVAEVDFGEGIKAELKIKAEPEQP